MAATTMQCAALLLLLGTSHAVSCPDAATEAVREANHLCSDGEEPRCVDTSASKDWKSSEVWGQLPLPKWSHAAGEHICEKPSQPMCRDDQAEFTGFMNPCKVQAQASRMRPAPEGGADQQAGGTGTGGGGGGGGATLTGSVHEAGLLGDVALTTATGTDPGTNQQFAVGENIFAAFEAGFTSQQDFILERLGCATASDGYLPGGIDTLNAELMVAQGCGITLPRYEGGAYVSLLDECGGHTNDYHFHERLSCLFSASGGHSTKVGEAVTQIQSYGYFVYGKWEDFDGGALPQLDACGGHFGLTPESPAAEVYHYHVQDNPPFVIGCFGPNDDGSLVTLQQCRQYSGGCDDGDEMTINVPSGSKKYDLWCPCYDADGSNSADSMKELAVFGGTPSPTVAGGTPAPTAEGAATPTATPTASPTASPTGEQSTSSGAAGIAGAVSARTSACASGCVAALAMLSVMGSLGPLL